MRPTRQLPVSRVATKRKDGGRVVYADELDAKAALRGHLGNKRYKTARDAPIAQGKLLEDLGHLANTPTAAEILSGNYRFPPGTDKATISILANGKGEDQVIEIAHALQPHDVSGVQQASDPPEATSTKHGSEDGNAFETLVEWAHTHVGEGGRQHKYRQAPSNMFV